MSERLPLSAPDIGPAEAEAVLAVLRTPQLSGGPRLIEFERRFAGYLGVPYACGVSSGTAALHLCLAAAAVGDGDLVVTTPLSFVSSANVILYQRAVPVFVDVEEETGNIDPEQVEQTVRRLRQDARPVRAVLPVHLFGQPADMDALTAVARRHDLLVIEDACEAPGAEYHGRKAGTLGDAAAFGFYPNKPLTTGEGGMAVTSRPEWARLFESLRNQGRDGGEGGAAPVHHRLGYNYRLDEMSAALGVAQLARIDELLRRRERVAGWYADRLAPLARVRPPRVAESTSRMCWFAYIIRLDPADRRRVIRGLGARGIPTRAYFRPIHLQPFYQQRFGLRAGDFPVAERLGNASLALPFSGLMTEEQVDEVCGALRSVLEAEAA